MNNTIKDAGLGIGGLLLALSGAGLAGIGPLASALGAGGGETAGLAASTPLATGATAGGSTAGSAAAGGMDATGAAAGGSGAAAGAGANAGANGLGAALGKPMIATGLGQSMGAVTNPPTTTTLPQQPQPAAPGANFAQLMSMFPTAMGGSPQMGPFA